MALITQIRRTSRVISCRKKTVMEVNYGPHLFSIWTIAAGAEKGMELSPTSIQMDREQASRLRDYLNEFLANSQKNT